jgi:hypothetical protein
VFRPPDVVLDDADGRHEYTLDGRPLLGLTRMLESAGLYDLSFVEERTLREAALFGDDIHKYTQWWDEEDFDLAPLEAFPLHLSCVQGWIDFRNDYDFVPTLIEQPLAITIDGMTFGCKPDCFGFGNFGQRNEKRFAVVEKKTTARFEPHFDIQTAGQAYAEKNNHPLPSRIIVRLLKEPNSAGRRYVLKECTNRNDDAVFRSVLAVEMWKFNNNITKGR